MTNIIYKQESYDIVGCLYEVYNNLGTGLLQIVYKDALEYEFKQRNIPFEREKQFSVPYKDIILKHKFYSDFVIKTLTDSHLGQCINYLKISKNKLGILANFKGEGLEYKRIVL